VLALVAAALFQTAALSLASSAWSLLPVAMGVAAIVLRLVPRPIVAAAALILAVAVVVLQLGLVSLRPGPVMALWRWARSRCGRRSGSGRPWWRCGNGRRMTGEAGAMRQPQTSGPDEVEW
jgi:hypothetical protein